MRFCKEESSIDSDVEAAWVEIASEVELCQKGENGILFKFITEAKRRPFGYVIAPTHMWY